MCLLTARLADEQVCREVRVGAALRDQPEHLALPGTQALQRVLAQPDQLLDRFRVHHRPPGSHPLDRGREVGHRTHPFLEQVAHPGPAARVQQAQRVGTLHVLAEDEHRKPGELLAQLHRGPQPVVALLRTVGAAPHQIKRMIIGEAAVVGLLGSLAGCAVGVAAAPLLHSLLDDLGVAPPGMESPSPPGRCSRPPRSVSVSV